MHEKNKQLGTQITPTSYCVSIANVDLKISLATTLGTDKLSRVNN